MVEAGGGVLPRGARLGSLSAVLQPLIRVMRYTLLPSEWALGQGPLRGSLPLPSDPLPFLEAVRGHSRSLWFPAAALPGLLSGAGGNRADSLEAAWPFRMAHAQMWWKGGCVRVNTSRVCLGLEFRGTSVPGPGASPLRLFAGVGAAAQAACVSGRKPLPFAPASPLSGMGGFILIQERTRRAALD